MFIIGCATGGIASQLVVPPAQAGTNPTRWDYYCAKGQGDVGDVLKKAGAEGWELVSTVASHYDHQFDDDLQADTYRYCFKRAIP